MLLNPIRSSRSRTFCPITRGLFCFGALALVLALGGCSRYQLTLNENVVYTPPPIFTQFTVASKALRNCLDQTIAEGGFTEPGQLKRLICTHAGIDSLAGLETFTHLRELDLGNNNIKSLEPVRYLSKLKVLILDHNQLRQAPELLSLLHLEQLNLEENPDLACGDLQQVKANNTSLELKLPKQCAAKKES